VIAFRFILSTGVCAAVMAACSQPAGRVEIAETSTRSETRPVPRVNATSDERFAPPNARVDRETREAVASQQSTAGDRSSPAPDLSMAAAQGPGLFAFEVPSGWKQIAASQFRDPNFVAGPNGEVECYVSVLEGTGGGLLINSNRWRSQLGREAYSEEEFGRLPRATVLGQDAVIVDFDGEFTPMGSDVAKPGYRLVGALIQGPSSAIFIKMVGPDAAVDAEKDNFARFAQSLRMAAASEIAAPEPIDTAGDAASAAGGEDSGYTWETPAGWDPDPAGSPMRLVTFRFGDSGAGECYVAVLPGAAGGRLENFNRWLAQMGEAPLEESELTLQPTVMLLGEEEPMLIAKGTYAGMGGESRPGHVLFGAIAVAGEESVFVKLVAPESLANGNLAQFRRFCASMKKN
jgi:hypothetical protein